MSPKPEPTKSRNREFGQLLISLILTDLDLQTSKSKGGREGPKSEPKKDETQKMISEIDKEGTRKMNLSNFLTVMTWKMFREKHQKKKKFLKVLKLFDDNETGKISFKNLKCVAKDFRENFTEEDLQNMTEAG